jgi:hypothetical protein
MYAHAWRKRRQLELSEVELYDTKTSILMYSSYVIIGLLSALVGATATGPAVRWAGLMYWLLGPVSAAIGWWRGSRRARVDRGDGGTDREASGGPVRPAALSEEA